MRDLFIHVGAHKTGTTAVQMTLAGLGAGLRSHGLTYPRSNWYHHSQHRLAFAMKGQKDPKAGDTPDLATEVAALNTAIAKADTDKVLISSEVFFSVPPAQIAALAAQIEGARVHVIAFVRRPDTFLISMYNQKIKGPVNSFAKPISSFVKDPLSIDADIAFATCIGNWTEVFGLAQTHLCIYEDGPPLAQILAAMDLPRDALEAAPFVNQSVPGAVIEAMRLSKITGMAPKKRARLHKTATKLFKGRPPLTLSGDDRRAILAALEPQTDALFAAFERPNPYAAAVFRDDPADPAGRSTLNMRDMMAVIDDLI
jgi:hypothetical protein